MKKIKLSEAFISAHFLERLSLRIPKYFNGNGRKFLSERIDFLRSINFPKEKFVVNLLKLKNKYINVIIQNNVLVTFFIRDNLSTKDAWPVVDMQKFKSEIDYIKSDSFPLGKFFYRYEDELMPYYFVIKDKNIIDIVKEVDGEKYKKYIHFTVD